MSAGQADNLWIETGDMTGGSRNQFGFPSFLAPFFNNPNGEIAIEYNGTVHPERPVSSRTTDPPYEQDVWPVYLPTGENYQNSVIHFRRVQNHTNGNQMYELEVAQPGSSTVNNWRQNAAQRGTTGQTEGEQNFDFGYY